MNESLHLRALSLGKRRSLGNDEFAALLDVLPHAALLADLRQGRILLANARLAELTALTPAELDGAPLTSLLTGPDGEPLPPLRKWLGRSQSMPLELLTRRGCLKASAALTPLNASGDLALISIESLHTQLQRQLEEERQEHLWDALYTLNHAHFQTDLLAAFSMVLQAGARLTGASWIGLYQADSDTPLLYRSIVSTSLDQTDGGHSPAASHPAEASHSPLPERIAPQDLLALHKPLLWSHGRRTIVQLHRQARLANLAYLASVPIGQPSALIGLLVAAGGPDDPPQGILEILMVLAASITALSESNAIRDEYTRLTNADATMAARYAAIVDSASDSILVLSPEQTILGLNPSAEQALGYTAAEVVGQPVENILISTTSLQPALQVAQHSFPAYQLGIIKLYRRSGQPFSANIRLLPITDNAGTETLLVIFQDLSEQEEYQLRNQQLEQRALLGEVTASFAHEVRNPINNISTGLQLLAINLPAEDANQETIKRLLHDCDRLGELVKSSLSFVRPMEYRLEPVNLAPVLSSLLERWEARLTRIGIKYRLQLEPGLPSVNGDIRALEQVFANLINNAMQAMEKSGGLLAIKAGLAGGSANPDAWEAGAPPIAPTLGGPPTYIEISVSDTGPGIPPDIRERIFEPFFTTKQNGTGLGLAIVKRIVTAHKGVISVTSIPGGTVFHLRLPALHTNLQENVP